MGWDGVQADPNKCGRCQQRLGAKDGEQLCRACEVALIDDGDENVRRLFLCRWFVEGSRSSKFLCRESGKKVAEVDALLKPYIDGGSVVRTRLGGREVLWGLIVNGEAHRIAAGLE